MKLCFRLHMKPTGKPIGYEPQVAGFPTGGTNDPKVRCVAVTPD